MAITNNDVHNIIRDFIKDLDLSLFYDDSNYKIYSFDEYEQFNEADSAVGYWYELKFLGDTVRAEALGISAKNEWRGIAQINVNVSKSIKATTESRIFDKGTEEENEYDQQLKKSVVSGGVQYIFDNAYAAIAEVIKRGVYINGVRIRRVYNSSAIDNGGYYTMPVSIEWWAHLER